MGGHATGHSQQWQRAFHSAAPADRAQNELVSQLALPISAGQTQAEARRVSALQGLFVGLDPTTASRMYGRLSNSGDSLGQLFDLTLHHATRASLMGVLAAKRANHHENGPDRRAPPSPPQPSPIPPPGPHPKQIQGQQAPTDPTIPIPPPPPDPWWAPRVTGPQQTPITPPTTGPGILRRLLNMGRPGVAMLGGLMAALSPEAVIAALEAALASLMEGSTFGRAGEVAAREILKRQLELKGLPGHVFDLNTIRKNFPGMDLITSVRPWQVKTWGVNSTRDKIDVAMSIVNSMVDLYAGPRLPNTTVKALLDARELLIQQNAWPSGWPSNPTADQLKVLLQDTAFAVPDDLVGRVRSAFGKRLVEDPRFREQIRDLSIGSLNDPKTLSLADQERWSKKVTDFLFTRVQPVGLTTNQVRTLLEVSQLLRNP
jgi:hypothetical protein